MAINRREFMRIGALTAAHVGFASFIPPFPPPPGGQVAGSDLYAGFKDPAQSFQAGCFWWWFNGLVSKEGITRDLREFHDKGIGEVLLINTSSGLGGARMPQGVKFLSDEWRALYRHALQEAARLGITVGVNFTSGWCMGGPWIDPQHAGRWFLQSRLEVIGPRRFSGVLPLPGHRDGYDKMVNAPGYKEYIDLPLEKLDYRDTAVVAFPIQDETKVRLHDQPAELFAAKTNRKDASNFIKAKDLTAPLLQPFEAHASDEAVPARQVIDLTGKMDKDGRLQWTVPDGKWIILRTGHRMTGSKLTIAQPEADGLSVDWLSPTPVDLQFEHLGKVLIGDAGDLKGKTLKYLHDDSFEDGFPNWTADILERFIAYRGYDARPYLPVLNGFIIDSVEVSERFLHDYRKTVADCMADGHYGHFARRCHEHGLLVHNEGAGPSRSGTMCMDGLKNLGRSDYPAGEFWLGLKHDEPGGLDEHQSYGVTRLEGGQNKVTKMTASAAHIYGKTLVSAESFTSFRHWLDYPGNMKQAADRAFCEGVNRMLIHAITCTRPEDGKPGYEYGAGTHFNPNVTWWQQAGPFLQYLARCQYLLRQGQFVADVLYYNGDWAPNIVEPKHTDPSLGKGYDYDVCNEEVLLTRLSVKDGLIVLPDGMHYRMLVLPDERRMPVAVARMLRTLVKAGATVVGPKPLSDPGLKDYPACDREVAAIGEEVWGACDGVQVKTNNYGQGRVRWNVSLREILVRDGVDADFAYEGGPGDFI
ncbi:MAG TPA: glycosyl hydrolase, partial [Puia sp.]|nr:glycosyl hydrolase [Puia sp.]